MIGPSEGYKKKIAELIESSNRVADLKSLEKIFGQFTLEILDRLEQGEIKKDEADRIFFLIDEEGLATNNPSKVETSEAIDELLFEGQILHDLGTPYGADLNMMKNLAKKLIQK